MSQREADSVPTIVPDIDTEFEEVALAEVRKTGDHYDLKRSDGWGFWLENPGFVPEAGQIARFYGEGIGRPVRGVVVGGKVAFYRTPEEERARRKAESAAYEERRRAALAETKIPDVVTPGFEWTEDMADISGLGGDYERACRQMISQGCAWWAQHPEVEPEFHGFKNITGICVEDNKDAERLSAAICADIDPSGAMHHAAVAHVLHWRKLGSWGAYQHAMRDLACHRAERTA